MLENYLTTAVRALAKNKLFSAINIVGLSIGLAVYVFSQLVADYERTHDGFFPDSERIYAIYAIIKADAGFGLRSSGGIQTSVRPLLAAEVPDIEVSARLIMREFLASYGDKKFYQGIRFADPAFLDIFRLDYIEGNGETALDDPAGVIMSESTARKFFGDESALGKVITFNNEHDLRVTAVFADIPTNSHFMSGIIVDQPLQMIGTTEALARIADWDIEGTWNNLNMGDVTYVKLPVGVAPETVNRQLAGLYDRHAPDRIKEFLGRFELRPLVDLNLFV